LQFAKNLVAMLLIEVWRLKAEGVQMYIRYAMLPRFIFNQRQKAMPMAATTQFIFYPH